MKLNKIMFSVHDYDFEGDIHTKGIFLHFGDTRIKVADNLNEFKKFTKYITDMIDEITENYTNEDV